MKKYYYRKQSFKLFGFITLFSLTLITSSCGTGKDENLEIPKETPKESPEETTKKDVVETVAAATQVAGKYFSECNSISELEKHLDEIRKTEGVVDVWTDDQTMYVDYEALGTIIYYYPIDYIKEENNLTRSVNDIVLFSSDTFFNFETRNSSTDKIEVAKVHHHLNESEKHSLVIYNAIYTDKRKGYQEATQKADELARFCKDELKYEENNIKVIKDTNYNFEDFFNIEMLKYDLVLLLWHGGCNEDGWHWYRTGQRYSDYDSNLPNDSIKKIIDERGINNNYKRVINVKEKDEAGNEHTCYYWYITDDYLSKKITGQFKNNSIVFNAACHSLEGSSITGDSFCKMGASCYLGYDNTNSVGAIAGIDFIKGLLNGFSVQTAFNNLDKKYQHDISYYCDIDEKGYKIEKQCNAHLKIVAKDNDEENKHVCITHSVTESFEENNGNTVLLKGSIKIADPNNDNEFGFALHTSGSNTINPIKPGLKYSKNKENFEYNTKSHVLTFSCSVDKKEFQDIDKFCAYLYDGERYCLGNLTEITIEIPTGEEMGYAEYENTVLTFKFGVKPEGKEIYEIPNDLSQIDIKYGLDNYKNAPGWYKKNVRKVVFDPSFADFRPICTNRWFCGVSEFVGLEYLNTSQVVDMSHMFYGCEDLEKLDLSHFDTKNVTNMEHMFDHCWKLSELNVSSFNTEKVKTMSHMFDHCWSINNLSLSNFDTSNVQDMRGMFSDCEFSLTSLDLSNFNTKNVLSMNGMFKNCDALENLDLSNFDTSNVVQMDSMFFSCNNLASLVISNFNTKKVSTMSYMFSGCKKLENLNVSSFDTSNVKNMRCMFRNCKSLTVLDLSSFNNGRIPKIAGMFDGCSNLKTIYVSEWITSWEINTDYFKYEYCFSGCDNLVGGKGSTKAILKSMQEKERSAVSSGDVFCAKIDEGHKSIFDIGFFTKK